MRQSTLVGRSSAKWFSTCVHWTSHCCCTLFGVKLTLHSSCSLAHSSQLTASHSSQPVVATSRHHATQQLHPHTHIHTSYTDKQTNWQTDWLIERKTSQLTAHSQLSRRHATNKQTDGQLKYKESDNLLLHFVLYNIYLFGIALIINSNLTVLLSGDELSNLINFSF